ncbi:MAG: hypothetical protein MOGMAGMI_00626 [Candidatus Omnitrophica bacterium]|nr:hypothetical protein [Candidatus Omnitrophota bacterium]
MHHILNNRGRLCLIVLVCSLMSVPATADEQARADKPAAAGKYPAFGLTEPQATLKHGAKVYETYCAGCHGPKGDGQGPAARFLDPKPRDFRTGQFRFSSRPSGELPTDEDLMRTIKEGLHGTSMPAWNLLPEQDRKAVIEHLKTFAPEVWSNAAPAAVTVVAEDPFYGLDRSEAIARGEKAYHGLAQCYSCHPVYVAPAALNEARASYGMPPLASVRPDPRRSKSTTNESGDALLPPDFTWNKLKRGEDLRELYLTVANGIGGAAMPTWKGILSEEDLWGMAYYIQDLASRRPKLVTENDLKDRSHMIEAAEAERLAYEKAESERQKAEAEAARTAQENAQPAVTVPATA